MIETSRYERNPVLAENGTCFHYIHDGEDEFHVLMICTLYDDLRYELFTKASTFNYNFNVLRDEDKFIYLLSNSDVVDSTASILNKLIATYGSYNVNIILHNFCFY